MSKGFGLARALGLIVPCVMLLAASPGNADNPAKPPNARLMPRATLATFSTDDALRAFLRAHLRRIARAEMEPAPSQPAATVTQQFESAVTVTAQKAAAAPGITNTQEAGVDEGDIVKVSGDTLVVLHRGRLYTVSIAGGALTPIDSLAAYPPGVDPSGDWYDEMLTAGDRIVVIGYSYSRGGTQIDRFRLHRDGHLEFTDAYQLRSNDYYSSRNYASRLVGHRLIFYTPLYLSWRNDPLEALPALRRWSGTGNDPGFKRIGNAQQVYIPARLRENSDAVIDTLHTVTSCDVTAPVLDCSAISVLGPGSRSFYVSGNAVYVWLTDWWPSSSGVPQPSLVYRLPLDGGRPSAVGVRGAPTDQFSFREDEGVLNVLVHSEGGGDAMWSPEFPQGAIALLRIPLEDFGNGNGEEAFARYRPLPHPGEGGFQNRFVGDYVLYGAGNSLWGSPKDRQSELIVAPVRGGNAAQFPLPHGIDRIEVMGQSAVVVGSDTANVYFTPVEFYRSPVLGPSFSQPGAQSETRSHGFFFNPDADGEDGVLGLPVTRPARSGVRQLWEDSAAVTFLRWSDRQFLPLGDLVSHAEASSDDHCLASCLDWYGNARPIFYQGRVFALMGYELVEGTLSRDVIAEKSRVDIAKRAPGPERVSR